VGRSIGDQELALLRHVAEARSATVGEVADSFGSERGLARSTVLTMMERLRHKGHLGRRQVDGVFRYFPRASAVELLREKIRGFVEQTLGGSVSPFVAYLSEEAELSDAELAELEDLVARLKGRHQESAS
jgi:predicted transcriptional regulator